MKLQGRHTVDAPREVVWRALLDPKVIAKTVPGCEELQQVGDHAYEGALRLRLGPVQGTFKGMVRISDINPPNSLRLRVSGKGSPGFVEGEGAVRLQDGTESTTIHYDFDFKIGGRLAGVGQRLMEITARTMTRQALEGLNRQVQGMAVAGESAPQSGPERPKRPKVAPPSKVTFAAGVVKGVLVEVIPPAWRRAGIAVGLLLVAVLLTLGIRACV